MLNICGIVGGGGTFKEWGLIGGSDAVGMFVLEGCIKP